MTLTIYKFNISFTYVYEDDPEKESPGSCKISENMFKKLFELKFNDCELISVIVKNNTSFEVELKTTKEYIQFMYDIQNIRFKVSGKLAKIADILILSQEKV